MPHEADSRPPHVEAVDERLGDLERVQRQRVQVATATSSRCRSRRARSCTPSVAQLVEALRRAAASTSWVSVISITSCSASMPASSIDAQDRRRPGPGRAARRPTGSRACAAARRRIGLGVLPARAPGGRPRAGRSGRAARSGRSPRPAARTRAGGTRPRTGCSQRTSASAATIRPVSSATIGWYWTTICSRSIAFAELLLEVVAAQDRGGHRRLEELEARLALGLRLVHGDVGVADQLVAVAADLVARRRGRR